MPWPISRCQTFAELSVHDPVGSFKASGFGLHDMLGNVWEWTEDCWNESYAGAPSDTNVWKTGDCSSRVRRGASWSSTPRVVRAAIRIRFGTVYRSYVNGFRIATSNGRTSIFLW
jgi:formylglycine-generating enzyme required for sulfatase activity